MSKDPSEVRVRRGALEDAEGIWRCIDVVVREGWFTFTESPPLEGVRSLLSSSESIQLVAESGAEVVGWCDITPIDEDGLRHTASLGMALLPGFRDRGLGRQLLRETLEVAYAAGLSRVELQLLASNERARALYEGSGFVHEGRKRVMREGVPVEILCMALERTDDVR
jgi:ribosomal protein S18 acetylase RimI-like enzyme